MVLVMWGLYGNTGRNILFHTHTHLAVSCHQHVVVKSADPAPRRFPILAQKFAFGGSTIALWGVFDGLSPRWQPLGLPLSAAVGAMCALVVTVTPCSAVGGCTSQIQLTHSLKLLAVRLLQLVSSRLGAIAPVCPSLNPSAYEVNNRFQRVALQMQLVPLHRGGRCAA
jgi:hypothetical protein